MRNIIYVGFYYSILSHNNNYKHECVHLNVYNMLPFYHGYSYYYVFKILSVRVFKFTFLFRELFQVYTVKTVANCIGSKFSRKFY